MPCNCSHHLEGLGINYEGSDPQVILDINYEERFGMACMDLISTMEDERRYVSLGHDEHRQESIDTLSALTRLVGVIVVLGEKMAETRPDCRTVQNRPVDFFFGPFENLCYERVKQPLLDAVANLEANQRSRRPDPSVDFIVSNNLHQIVHGGGLPKEFPRW